MQGSPSTHGVDPLKFIEVHIRDTKNNVLESIVEAYHHVLLTELKLYSNLANKWLDYDLLGF
jgi:hypothetical protein